MANKKFRLIIGAAVLLALLLSGCTTTATAPFFYSNNSNYDFIILGEVTYESATKIGFQELLKAARSKYRNCDYVIDVMVDSQTTTTSFLFLSGTSTTYTMRGTAIQYVRNTPDGQATSTLDQDTAVNTKPAASAVPSVPASTGAAEKPSSVTRTEESYTVQRVFGTVQRESGGTYVDIKVGDVLTGDTIVRLGLNSSLTLSNGRTTFIVPAGRIGKLANVIKQ